VTPRGHAVRPSRQESERVAGRRLAIVAVVVAVVVGAALIDRAVGPPPSPSAPSALSASTIPSTAAVSSSWYCAGGTTGSGGQANTTIYVTNTGTETVPGAVTTTVNTGKGAVSTHQTISVPAGTTITVNPEIYAPGGWGASTLTFAGGGIGVSQVAAGPAGWTTAPCASASSANWYFASGATTPGNQLVLILYNPTSTEAVANVSFDTDAGVLQPQLYQGLSVPAGQVVVENVGDYVQSRPTIATVVSAQSGQIVADQLQLVSTTGKTGLALALGAPRVAPDWYFSQTTNPTAAGSSVSFLLSNPGPTAERAMVAVGLTQGGVAPFAVAVPAKSVVPFTASTANRIPHQVPYAVAISSTGGSGLVVAREVLAPDGASQPGFGTMPGTAQATSHWLVPAPGAGSAPGAPGASVGSLAVSNPGSVSAQVTVAPLGGTAAQSKVLVVKPHSVLVVAQAPVGGLVTLDVRSNVPVAVEEDSVPTGAAGVVSSTGLPFG
jgi:hypothetical protein